MGRGKHLHGAKPWEEYGLTQAAYYARKAKGLPLDAKLRRGRKPSQESEEIRRLAQEIGFARRPGSGRYSGKKYKNPPERLDAIREKYKDGVSLKMIEEWINGI